MDAIDNLIFATLRSPLRNGNKIASDYIPGAFDSFVPGVIPTGAVNPVWGFSNENKESYSSFPDYSVIETAIVRHWYDINGNGLPPSAGNFQYIWPGDPAKTPPVPDQLISDFTQSPGYHLIYSYLIENSRILQIFERLIEKYVTDEELGIAPPGVFQWLINSERLFFKDDTTRSTNIRSLLRPSFEANRRNAYYRMFGMDLAFGDTNSASGGTFPYVKAKTANQQFIVLFERYLSEVWQGYINARNSSGPNTADVNNIVELAIQLRELLFARRGGRPGGAVNSYASTNLSMEEFSSVILVSWFAFIISYNSNVVQFLNCQSSTIGERLIKIGTKVGVPAHTRSQSLFEMAGSAANILCTLEIGSYLEGVGNIQKMLGSLDPNTTIRTVDSDFMNSFLTVINNWEKATGHKIKNFEPGVTGTVKVQQNGVKVQPAMN